MARISGVEFAEAAGVTTLILDRAPVNALTTADLRDIMAGVRRIPDGAHALVIRARNRGFGAGNALGDFPAEPHAYRGHVAEVQAMLEAIKGSPTLTIALVHGFCVGSSALLASACDVVVAARSAWFRFPEIEIGAPGGYRLLLERMSPASAREVLLSCRRLDAVESQVLGLVDRIVDDADLDGAAEDYLSWFGPLASWGGAELPALKQELDRVARLSLWEGYAAELDHGARMRAVRRSPIEGSGR